MDDMELTESIANIGKLLSNNEISEEQCNKMIDELLQSSLKNEDLDGAEDWERNKNG